MGEELPILSAREVLKALAKLGFRPVRQRGSHIVVAKITDKGKIGAVVPNYDEITRGTMDSVLEQAKLTKEEFRKLLKK
jgi:predicted RNA binding protein YcfA (HicA-like mRNA interferase family)